MMSDREGKSGHRELAKSSTQVLISSSYEAKKRKSRSKSGITRNREVNITRDKC